MNIKSHYPCTRIAYTWGLVFIGIVIYTMFWFIFGWSAMAVIEAVEQAYTFGEPASLTVTLLKNVVAWHPIIAVVGWLIYGFLSSMRKEPREYQEW